jgi:hemoglobin
MSATLFERLGGEKGINKIARDLMDAHLNNPVISRRYVNTDVPAATKGAAEFFITGTGGPSVYKGKDMVGTHRGMNISNDEFMAVLDDVLVALNKNQIGQREKEEVLFTFFSMKNDVVGQ